MSSAASRIHCSALQIGVAAVVHADRAVVLVESRLVVGQEVDAEEHRAELAEVRDVALHVLLGPVPGGVHPLQAARRRRSSRSALTMSPTLTSGRPTTVTDGFVTADLVAHRGL